MPGYQKFEIRFCEQRGKMTKWKKEDISKGLKDLTFKCLRLSYISASRICQIKDGQLERVLTSSR